MLGNDEFPESMYEIMDMEDHGYTRSEGWEQYQRSKSDQQDAHIAYLEKKVADLEQQILRKTEQIDELTNRNIELESRVKALESKP